MTVPTLSELNAANERFAANAVLTLTDPDTGLVFTYQGGAYIDIAFEGADAHEVINVWDYENGRSVIGATLSVFDDFTVAVHRFLVEAEAEEES